MDKYKYSKDIQNLIDNILEGLSTLSPDTLKYANKLLKIANNLNDDSLKSFAYYNKALYYYFKAEISSYRPLIKKAAYYALKSDDQMSLSRIYNFIAVDTHNNGCFDIAFNYYILAYNYAQSINDEDSMAIIESNLGRLYLELNEYQLSRKYIRNSIKKFSKEKELQNYIETTYFLKANDGIISLMLDDIKAAEKSLKSVDTYIKKSKKDINDRLHLPRELLATRLALKKNNKNTVRKELNILIELLKKEQLIQELIDDISGLYHDLMNHNMKKEAKLLIDSTDKAFMSKGITYVNEQFLELKANYYESIKDNKNLFKVLKEQYKQNIKLRNEQQEMYAHAVSLISLLDGLREEQNKVRNENEALKQISEIDALTGIANRFKMNQVLNNSNYENKALAIGILDIDYFKEYNDNYGHQQGDKCLIKVAKELSKIAKNYNLFCARYGGDEFVIVYEGLKTKELEEVVKLVHEKVLKLKIKHEHSAISNYVTISQGVCYGTPENKAALWAFLGVADEELYAIKKSRKANAKSYKLMKYKTKK